MSFESIGEEVVISCSVALARANIFWLYFTVESVDVYHVQDLGFGGGGGGGH